jgi:hypothetical protein
VDTSCAFAVIRYYQNLAWREVITMIGLSRVFFWPGSPEFQIDGIRSSVLDWIAMVHSLLRLATEILHKDLLLGIPKEQFGFLQPHITDKPTGHRPNAGFAASQNLDTSSSAEAFKNIMAIFMENSTFRKKMMDPDMKGGLHKPGLYPWLNKVKEFKKILFFILHITSGNPKRITEMIRHKLFDTDTRSRNFYWILDKIFIIGDYSKTSALTGSDKKTIHIVPPAIQELLLIFLMVVLPLEIYFVSELEVKRSPNWHCYLFSSLGKRWSAQFTRSIAKKFTRKYLGQAFGIGQIRHISPGIIQAFRLDWTDPTTSYDYRKQAGHSVGVGGSLYAQSGRLLGLVTNDEANTILKFSERYHKLWGLESGLGPVPRTTADLRELSDPVGTMARMMFELAALRHKLSEFQVGSCSSSLVFLCLCALSTVLNAN